MSARLMAAEALVAAKRQRRGKIPVQQGFFAAADEVEEVGGEGSEEEGESEGSEGEDGDEDDEEDEGESEGDGQSGSESDGEGSDGVGSLDSGDDDDDDDEEEDDDGYGNEGLSWEAVMATIQGGSATPAAADEQPDKRRKTRR